MRLALILILAGVLRLGTIQKLMVFTSDEAYQAYITQTLIKNFHIIWIGLSAGGFDLYTGPLWNYILYPFLRISQGDPVAMGVATSLLGIAATYLTYYLGRKMYSERVGIIASLLYAALPLMVYYDQKPYPPGVSFLSLLILLSLFNLKYSGKWLLVFAAAYGMVFHAHLSLIPLIFVALYWIFLQKSVLTKKIVFLSIVVFLLVVSPLIAFDYFHKGSNITTPIRIWKSAAEGVYKSPTQYHLSTLLNSLGRVWYLPAFKSNTDEVLYTCSDSAFSTRTKSPWLFSALSVAVMFVFVFKKDIWRDDKKRLLLLLSVSYLLPFTLLSIINPVEYYLLGFFPILFLMFASVVESVKNKSFLYSAITILVALGVFTVFSAKGDYGIGVKRSLVAKAMNVIGNNPYELTQEGDCHKYGGWRYIFSVYGRRPERSSEDPVYGWLYPDEISTLPVKYSLVVKETKAPISISESYKSSVQKGGYTAYIYER